MAKKTRQTRRLVPRRTAAAKPPEGKVRIILVGPSSMYDDVIKALQETHARTGEKIQFRMDDLETVGVTTEGPRAVAADQAVPAALPAVAARGRTRSEQRRDQVIAAQGGGVGASVVYRVVDRTPQTGTSRGPVHHFLMLRGAHSKREIMAGTGLGMKQVESAIHAMKVDGVVEAVPVVEAVAG